jgi:nucleotide-binding universal stress UspA family protein
MSDIKRILVPTDFSAAADAALNYAVGLAAKLGATVSAVHVFDDPFVAGGVFSGEYVPMPPELREEMLQDLRRRLADTVAKHGHSELSPQVLIGPTARTIVDSARDARADLIVMGTHGRSGISHVLLGSIAERVVRTAECPVLTVRSRAARAAA